MTPEQRRIRLKNDYQSIKNIARDWLKWRALNGSSPYIDSYEIELRIRTIVDDVPSYRSQHKLKVDLPPDYPESPPVIKMLSSPGPFHPNWYSNGAWCPGGWDKYESLGEHIVRMIKTLQYDREITNEKSAANHQANDWYLRNKNSGLFPCDKTELPDPTSNRITFVEAERKTIKFLD